MLLKPKMQVLLVQRNGTLKPGTVLQIFLRYKNVLVNMKLDLSPEFETIE